MLKLWLAVLLMQGIQISGLAQDESYEDIIPFRKGNKWGLGYHSGRTFYPPVFEEVYTDQYHGTFFFTDEETGSPYFSVKKDGKHYKLTTAKKLVADKKRKGENVFIPPSLMPEDEAGPPEIDEMSVNPDPVTETRLIRLVKTIQPDLTDTALVRIYKDDSRFRFHYKGKWVEALECDAIVEELNELSDKWELILRKNGKTGVADLHPPHMALPFRYDAVSYLQPGNFFLVINEGKYGLLNLEDDEWVIPLQQKEIMFIDKDGYGYYYFQVTDTTFRKSLVRADYSNEPLKVLADSIENMLNYRYSTGTTGRSSFSCFVISKNKKWGIIDGDGNTELPFIYDKIVQPRAGIGVAEADRFLILNKGNLQGWMDLYLHIIVQPRYKLEGVAFGLKKEIKSVPVFVFQVNRNGITYYVDNFGKEFYAR